MPLDVRVHEGRIEIEPAPLAVRLEKRGRFLVAVPQEPVPILTAETVEETRGELRRERGGAWSLGGIYAGHEQKDPDADTGRSLFANLAR